MRANATDWLPTTLSHESLTAYFGKTFALQPIPSSSDTPSLRGAEIVCTGPVPQPSRAWETALHWLRDFRQAVGRTTEFARDEGRGRPGRSRWPEPDKIRRLTAVAAGNHQPRVNAAPAWPRAGFGLPILGRFSTPGDPSGQFTLSWRRRPGEAGEFQEFKRLASPLIVKAVSLAGGGYAPVALWLNRANPERGEVFLQGHPESGAPFDRLKADGDDVLYKPLDGHATLRAAFLDWLARPGQIPAANRIQL